MANIKEAVFFLSLYILVIQRLPDLVLTFHSQWYKYPQFNLLQTDDTSSTITAVSKRKSHLPEAQHTVIKFYLYSGQRNNLKATDIIKSHQLNDLKNHLSSLLSIFLILLRLIIQTFVGLIAVGGKFPKCSPACLY